jgi:hypothetical protein
MLTVPIRRDPDVKCINRNRAGEREGSVESISLSYFRGQSWGIDISSIDFFLCRRQAPLSTTCVCPLFFIRLNPDVREISVIWILFFGKSLDIPFLNCLILPERSLHPGITSVLLRLLSPPFLFLYIPSFDRFLFGVPPPIRRYYIIHRLFLLFPHSLRSFRRFRRSILTAAGGHPGYTHIG